MAQQFITSSGAAVGPRIQEIDQTGVVVQRPVGYWRYVSWGAIFAGTVLALATHLLLTLLGAGIGLVALGATSGADSGTATGFGIGAAIWWLISGLIAMFVGGLAAGRLARVSQVTDGILHGLLVWAVATFFSLYLLTTTASALMGGMFSALNSYVQSGRPIPGVEQPINMQGGGMNGQPAAGGQQQPSDQTTATDQQRAGGQPQVGDTQITRQEAQQAASNLGQAALWSFFALALGAAAGALGGSLGRYAFSRFDEPTTVVSRTPSVPGAAEHQARNE